MTRAVLVLALLGNSLTGPTQVLSLDTCRDGSCSLENHERQSCTLPRIPMAALNKTEFTRLFREKQSVVLLASAGYNQLFRTTPTLPYLRAFACRTQPGVCR
jgi:hypothetical protein